MSKLYRVKEGQWIRPKMTGHILGCCDCGLIHRMDFRIGYVDGDIVPFVRKINGKRAFVLFRAYRDNRRTALSRRGKQRVKIKKKSRRNAGGA